MRYRLRTLLIVLALGPMVVAGLYWWVRDARYRHSAENSASAQVDMLCGAVQLYEWRQGNLPPNLEVLPTASVLRTLPTDPWGHQFRYELHSDPKSGFRISSDGRDGVSGTPDDISRTARRQKASPDEN